MGRGTKRAIPIEKITNSADRAVAFSKRRHGLYSKATELCLLSGAQVAVLATPVSKTSHVSFYAYGHSSADYVVSTFLKNERPKSKTEELGLRGRWWEDEGLVKSEDTNQIKSAIASISSMLKDLKALRLKAVEKQKDDEEKLVSQREEEDLMLVVSDNNNDSVLITYDCKDAERIFDLAMDQEDLEKNKELGLYGTQDQTLSRHQAFEEYF